MVLQPGVRAVPLRWESQVQDTGPQETSQLHIISNGENLPEISISAPRPSPLNDQQAAVLDTLCQTTSKTGTQPHPLAERLPKIIIRPQTPENTPPDVDLPPERQGPTSSTRTQALVPSTRKPTQSTKPTLATGDRHQKQRELQTCSLKKGDPKHSKLSKVKRQRNTQQMKEQGKNPPDLTNEEEIGSLPEK